MKKLFFATVLFTLPLKTLFALTFQDMSTENITIKVREWLQTAEGDQAPIVMDGFMLLARKDNPQTNYRGIAFRHEDFRIVHKFMKNKLGTFIMAYKLPEGQSPIVYRLICDGLWSADALNRCRIRDSRGFTLSCLPLPQPIADKRATPYEDGGVVIFRHADEPGQTIFLTGDFNQTRGMSAHSTVSAVLNDSLSAAENGEIKGTYQEWGEQDNTEPIDFIFSSDDLPAVEYQVLDDISNGYISDHYGVYTEFVIA